MRNGKPIKQIRQPIWNMIYKWDAWQPTHVEPRFLLGESVIEKLTSDKKGVGIVNSGDLKNYGFSFGKISFMQTYNEFQYEMTNKKKDGSLGATKKHTISIYHTYCPFCGEKFPVNK